MKIRINIDIKVGRIVKYLVLVDLFLLFGWGFIDPIFSVFIIQRIAGATLVTVGVAVALFWVLKSLLQIPIANYLDRTPGEKDDFAALVGGLVIAGFSALAFSWIVDSWQLYLVQAVKAVGFALYIPSWSSLFSRHLDHDRMSFDWSLDSTAVGIAAGASGLLAGIVADAVGFVAIFVVAGVFSLAAALVLIAVPDFVIPKPNKDAEPQMKEKESSAAKV